MFTLLNSPKKLREHTDSHEDCSYALEISSDLWEVTYPLSGKIERFLEQKFLLKLS